MNERGTYQLFHSPSARISILEEVQCVIGEPINHCYSQFHIQVMLRNIILIRIYLYIIYIIINILLIMIFDI